MSFLQTLAGVGKVLGGLGGLFGRKAPTPAQSLMSHAMGARQAAERTGFNPLTLLGVAPAPWGADTPPLASVEALTGGLQDLDDISSGRVARQNAAQKLQLELAQLELETARANLGMIRNPSAAGRIPGAPGAVGLGGKPTVQPPGAAVPSTAPYSASDLEIPTGLAPERDVEAETVKNLPGFVKINNALAGDLYLPGEEAPEGLDVYAMAPLALPQMVYNYGKMAAGQDETGRNKFRAAFGVGPSSPNATPRSVNLTPGYQGPSRGSYDLRQWPFKGLSFSNYRN